METVSSFLETVGLPQSAEGQGRILFEKWGKFLKYEVTETLLLHWTFEV